MSDSQSSPPEATEEVPSARPSIIGRKDEMLMLLARTTNLGQGRGGTQGIRADSGLGKTHLSREAITRVKGQPAEAVLVPCRGTLHRAYYPLAGLVRSLLDIGPDWRSREQLAYLEKSLPELGLRDPNQVLARLLNVLPPSGSGPLEESRPEGEDRIDDTQIGATALVVLPDVLSGLLSQKAARSGGLCIIFDDLDEAHADTISLIGKLADKIGGSPILIGATFAPSPPDALQAIFGRDVITLGNLDQKDALALGATLAEAKRLTNEFADKLWAVTNGDPLFISLLMHDLAQTGRIAVRHGSASLTDGDMPSTLVQLITAQASHLTDSQRETMTCAAVLGDGFRMGALSALRGRASPADLEADLNALVEAGWLERSGKGRQTSYLFTHRIKRNLIYKNIPDDRRNALHKSAGDYYAVITAGQRIRVQNAMYHYLRSGDTRRALPVVEMAINKARAAGDQEQLGSLYQLGIEAAAADPSLSAKQIEMAEHLGDMVASGGDYARAAEIYTHHSPSITSPMVLSKLGLATLASDPPRAANVLSRALASFGSASNDDTRWVLEASLCWALSLSGSSYEAIRRCRDVLGKLGDTVGFGEARTLMRAMLGIILFYEGDLQEATPHLESARAGWGARSRQEGVLLINQVLISMPKSEITRIWLKMVFTPMLKG